jgi:hypothetical protein
VIHRLILSVVAACAMTGSVAFAQTMETTPIPKPAKPDFSSMEFMVGTWSCSTKSGRRPTPYLSTTTYTLDPTGFWLIGKSESKGVPWFPYPSAGTDWITYDADTSRWIDVNVSDFGGYDLSSSKGWKRNVMVWHDLAAAPGKDVKSSTDTVNTKVSATKMTAVNTFTTVKGKAVSLATTCTKES